MRDEKTPPAAPLAAVATRPAVVAAGRYDVGIIATLQEMCFDQPWGRDFVARMFAVQGGYSLLLKATTQAGRTPIGFAMCQIVVDEAELLTLGVLPQFRGRGLGRLLVLDCLDRAQDRGVRSMFLEVSERNRPAQRLYQSAGFSIIGRRPKYYREIDGGLTDALNMRCDLQR
ncbi:MAG: ribosomal protein S18-alanine N-acetyltransferase [Alphaproteobacteria bacterium]|nr:ribosomal protein S18-alanine N-acetyltransferase [Alphaproteobacteria bacterium]MBU0796555.1 ribosomal protein S18-alanine N-acetyltransferase [Alphaproteobacteria bacterium]MBU0886376.1 ribosomal protein S18-alanine N-acetyltransferase [Alphaproteobacteria bacterium]MBU1813428.1 ribosomal protein S18-alanine N-acetyltransferase [Alphaproteobacteria bacterium]MBU2090136.1 ribosomal protein S18-alanine N-acetyltransferase [Alphaproteobacteria bacterium]